VLENPETEFVKRFWRDTVASFPENMRGSAVGMEEKLHWFFKEVELLRRENEIIRRDEEERRKGMLLLGDKIRLLNQPVREASKE
jgi:hypothetical protein